METNWLANLFQQNVVWVLIPLAAIIGGFWSGLAKTRSRNALKQSMIERGMSPEEIERVLRA
jgi:hypothetical protein